MRIVKNPVERKAEIVAAARHLFQQKDYDQATLQDVMSYLGIAKGTIYHYFKSKEELLEAVVEDMVAEHLKKMKKGMRVKGNALNKLQAMVKAGKTNSPQVLEALHKKGNEALHTRLLVATLMRQAPLYAQVIQRGCQEGLFHTHHPLESAEFILTAVQFLTDLGIYPWSPKDLQRRGHAFSELIEQLLRAPPGSFKFLNG